MLNADIVRFFLLLTVFAAVFLAIPPVLRFAVDKGVHIGAVNRRLGMIRQGLLRETIVAKLLRNDPSRFDDSEGLLGRWLKGLRRNLLMSGLPLDVTRLLFYMVILFAGTLLIIAAGVWFANYPFGFGIVQVIIALSASIAIAIPLLVISFLGQRKRKLMESQFPVSLDIFVRALRSGHPVAAAIELLTEEMPDPIGTEFGIVSDEIAYGADLTEALLAMAERWDLDDMRMFVVSIAVQNETGGNLAEILENLSKVIRDRMSLYMKVRALSSEGRMTGWVLTAAPIITFVLLFLINPGFYLDVALDPIFYIGFPVMILWYLLGLIWIQKLVNLKV